MVWPPASKLLMLAVGTFCMAAVAIVASPTCPDGMTSLDTFEWKAEVSVTVCSPNLHPLQLATCIGDTKGSDVNVYRSKWS